MTNSLAPLAPTPRPPAPGLATILPIVGLDGLVDGDRVGTGMGWPECSTASTGGVQATLVQATLRGKTHQKKVLAEKRP